MDNEQPDPRSAIPSPNHFNWRAWLPTRGNVLFSVLLALGVAGALMLYVRTAGAFPFVAPAAASTSVIPYQGRLADAGGVALTGTYSMTFNLYSVASGGSPLWSEAWLSGNSVAVTNGLFNVMLGSLTPIPPTVFASNGSLWLGITVGADSEMAPRVQLGSAPYALESQHARVADQTNSYYPLDRPQTLDLAAVNPGLVAFAGGFSDGRYAYFAPNFTGKVARVDSQNFTTVTWLDLADVDPDLVAFAGGFSDGHYGYFVPNNNNASGKVARVDLQTFTTLSVTVLNLTNVDPMLKGFIGGFSDGHYGYFVPYNNGVPFGMVARVDLQNFTPGGVTVLDLVNVDPTLQGFKGGFSVGRYGYLVPYNNGAPFGKVVRIDLQTFPTGVTVLDLTTADASLKGFEGGFSDGRYGYFVPNHNGLDYSGKVARVDLQNFTASGVTVLDLTLVDPDLKGFIGGFTDGRYGYFAPSNNGAYFGKVARVDLQNFTTSGVTVMDMTTVDPDLKGFSGGFSDGRYGYFVPHGDGVALGKVARIQLFFGGGSP